MDLDRIHEQTTTTESRKKRRRQFRYSYASDGPLSENAKHRFALKQTLKIFAPNAAYTFVPKNGCSTMRLSVALANGCINDPSQANWIHANNDTFSMTTESAFLADYTFTFLRCPFRRLYSAFMNKIVDMDSNSWQLSQQLGHRVMPHQQTFARFVDTIATVVSTRQNAHWRPQVDFLLYEEYDDYFCLEDFAAAVGKLKREIDLDVIDSRGRINHDVSSITKVEGVVDAHHLCATDLNRMKSEGTLPDIYSMYSDELIAKVGNLYREDIAFYASKFGSAKLVFDGAVDA